MHLYQALATRVNEWRNNGYPVSDFPVIAEIIEWSRDPEGSGLQLREPQLRALETYWYLRLVQGTLHIVDLYKEFFPRVPDLLQAIGLDNTEIKDFVIENSLDELF